MTKMDNDYASVVQQSGIKAGSGGFQVNVNGNTNLAGAVIESNQTAVDKGLNSLTTGSLTVSNIQNHADYSAESVSASIGGSMTGTAPMSNMTQFGNGVSGSPAFANASSHDSSTTTSGISGGTLVVKDGSGGNVDRSVTTATDTTHTLTNSFNADQIQNQLDTAIAFQQQGAQVLANVDNAPTVAQQKLDNAQKALDAANASGDQAQIDAATTAVGQARTDLQSAKDLAAQLQPGTPTRTLLTALLAGAGGNVSGGMSGLVQDASVAYIQGLTAQQVKLIADGTRQDPNKEDATSGTIRAVLQGIVACAGGAASTSGNCGSQALGASGAVALNAALDRLMSTSADTMTPEQKQQRLDLITSILGGLAAATGGNGAAAAAGAQTELVNNSLVKNVGVYYGKQVPFINTARKQDAFNSNVAASSAPMTAQATNCNNQGADYCNSLAKNLVGNAGFYYNEAKKYPPNSPENQYYTQQGDASMADAKIAYANMSKAATNASTAYANPTVPNNQWANWSYGGANSTGQTVATPQDNRTQAQIDRGQQALVAGMIAAPFVGEYATFESWGLIGQSAIDGSIAGGGASAYTQYSKNGQVDGMTVAKDTAVGGVIGAGVGKVVGTVAEIVTAGSADAAAAASNAAASKVSLATDGEMSGTASSVGAGNSPAAVSGTGATTGTQASANFGTVTAESILQIPKGQRPDPSSYLSPSYIDNHLSQFSDGVSKISANAPAGYVGPPGGTFVMPAQTANTLIYNSGGNVSTLESLLSLEPGSLGASPVRIDISNPSGLRMPSGNELGANSQWIPGGFTGGGIPEATINPAAPGTYVIKKIFGE